MTIVDYQASIEITFDKEILTDPAIVIGTEYYKPVLNLLVPSVYISSIDYSTYYKQYAFDGDLGTSWMPSGGTVNQWIGRNFGSEASISKVRIKMGGLGRVNGFKIQGSIDGIAWNDIYTGNWLNNTNWQEIIFASTTYQYWRMYTTSIYGYWSEISELEFLSERSLYNVAAWTVTGQEYNRTPDGQALAETYTVRKVTKSLDNLTVKLWLSMSDRMEAPIGDISVSYNKDLGNLAGDFDAEVASFTQVFTPINIVPIYLQPNDPEYLSSNVNMTLSCLEVTYKYIPAESNTFLIPDQDNTYMDESLSAQANMTIVVTKVGDQPL